LNIFSNRYSFYFKNGATALGCAKTDDVKQLIQSAIAAATAAAAAAAEIREETMALNASLLIAAACDGNTGAVRACIEAEADVNSKDTVGIVYLCVSVSFFPPIICFQFFISDVLYLFCHLYIFVILVVSILHYSCEFSVI
jgi:hypothetical protein